ncbi:MAG: hypothetical protein EPN85_03725 [Bacteroidetes bacterium]|nr:MAG: hypothetical protein EPN85_03725 [Bacteroidota bacterium]
MKKIIFFLLIMAIATIGFAQSFDKGNRNFDFKLDVAGYSGTVTDNQTKIESKSGAASIVFTPQMTWGTGKKISMGTSLAYSNYLDSAGATGSNPTLRGLDANFLFDFHFLRRPKTDMMAGLKLGIAGVRYNPNDGTGDIYGSMGSAFDLHFTARFYVSEKVGIIANLAFPKYRFGKFGKNMDYTYTINFSGFCFGTGVAINLAPKKAEGK